MSVEIASLSLDALDIGEESGHVESSIERDARETVKLAVSFCTTPRARELSDILDDRRFTLAENLEAVGMLDSLLVDTDDENDTSYGQQGLDALETWRAG